MITIYVNYCGTDIAVFQWTHAPSIGHVILIDVDGDGIGRSFEVTQVFWNVDLSCTGKIVTAWVIDWEEFPDDQDHDEDPVRH